MATIKVRSKLISSEIILVKLLTVVQVIDASNQSDPRDKGTIFSPSLAVLGDGALYDSRPSVQSQK
jgi:hypothetical protein